MHADIRADALTPLIHAYTSGYIMRVSAFFWVLACVSDVYLWFFWMHHVCAYIPSCTYKRILTYASKGFYAYIQIQTDMCRGTHTYKYAFSYMYSLQ